MDVIVHEAPGKAARATRRARIGDQLEVGDAVFVGKEDRQAAVAALRDMMRDMRDDDASEPGHEQNPSGTRCINLFSIVSPEFPVSPELRVPGITMGLPLPAPLRTAPGYGTNAPSPSMQCSK